MTRTEIMTRLREKKDWTVCRITNDLWSYIDITEKIRVGRHHFEWAIFKLGKNQGFHFATSYKDIPPTLVAQLFRILNIGTKK